MDFAQEPPCPHIVRGQKKLTLEQEAYARQFAQERATAMLEPEVDELAAEDHLRRAYQVAGLVPPRIRWFDSPLAFNQARKLEAETEQARDQEAKELWDDMQACITRLLIRMGLLPLHIYQRKRRGGGGCSACRDSGSGRCDGFEHLVVTCLGAPAGMALGDNPDAPRRSAPSLPLDL
ncbi:MAG TPA: hypothetical protein VF043_16565 [Ktedonobacteraceae bacterium]